MKISNIGEKDQFYIFLYIFVKRYTKIILLLFISSKSVVNNIF